MYTDMYYNLLAKVLKGVFPFPNFQVAAYPFLAAENEEVAAPVWLLLFSSMGGPHTAE